MKSMPTNNYCEMNLYVTSCLYKLSKQPHKNAKHAFFFSQSETGQTRETGENPQKMSAPLLPQSGFVSQESTESINKVWDATVRPTKTAKVNKRKMESSYFR